MGGQINVIIETVKMAEDDDGIIVRLYESENAKTKAHIFFGEKISSVESCNCLEEIKQTIETDGEGFEITVKIHMRFRPTVFVSEISIIKNK